MFCVGSEPILTPKVATTYLGGSITFTCKTSDPSMTIIWRTKVNYAKTSIRTIQIDNIEQNNTIVQCGTKHTNQHHFTFSNEGMIKLQGNIILLFSVNQLIL